jgi:hypothetical protein
VWNEVEDHYKDMPDETKRNLAKIYGVVYFYRKSELVQKESQEIIPPLT